MANVLVTGGAGYIGTHVLLELLKAGHNAVVIDNLSNATAAALKTVEHLSNRPVPLYVGDVQDRALLSRIFATHAVDQVIHLAGVKAVGESVAVPLKYFDNNVAGSLALVQEMAEAGVFTLVFSSTATVYGTPDHCPLSESAPVGNVTSPYARSKRMVEEILQDLVTADPRWRVGVLRYFNPVGAHESGTMGESPKGIPNNLMPYLMDVAAGVRPALQVFGNDYPTPDGTGVRDYLHVMDLAEGHLAALEYLSQTSGLHVWNLGTGRGHSVLEVLRACEAVIGRNIPFEVVARRSGDVAAYYADPTKASTELGWRARRTLMDMARDAWRWRQRWQVASKGPMEEAALRELAGKVLPG